MTFAATANMIVAAGGKPVFVDVNLRLQHGHHPAETAITPQHKVYHSCVHFAGLPRSRSALYSGKNIINHY